MGSASTQSEDCGCRIVEVAGGQFEIEYCAVHKEAFRMYNLIKEIMELLEDGKVLHI